MRHAGVIVTINREGDAQIIRGLVRETDRKLMAAAMKAAGKPARSERVSISASPTGAAGRACPEFCVRGIA
jgi:ParB family transcriptional regulator, chromosome partitioning protein